MSESEHCTGVSSIDNTGIGMLGEVHKSLDRKGITVMSNARPVIGPQLNLQQQNLISPAFSEPCR